MQDQLEDNSEMFHCKVCYIEPDNGININSSDNENLFAFLKQRGLKVFHQSINGIISKLDKIEILIGEARQIHVFAITETKLDNNILAIDGYTVIRKDRTSGLGVVVSVC